MSSNPFDFAVSAVKTVSGSAVSAVKTVSNSAVNAASDFFSTRQEKDDMSLLQEKNPTLGPDGTERHTYYGACILGRK